MTLTNRQHHPANPLYFQALRPRGKELLAYGARDCRLRMSDEENKTYNRVVQIERDHSNRLLGHN